MSDKPKQDMYMVPVKKQCKSCKDTKLRIWVGMFDEKNKKYVDENDKLWNGLRCPECHNSRTKKTMRRKRFRDEYFVDDEKKEENNE